MAIVKLWSCRESVSHSSGSIISATIDYAVNEDKTKNITTVIDDSNIDASNSVISNAVKYVVNEDKTHIKDGSVTQIEEVYVSSINCSVDNAETEFMKIKEYWGKTDKTLLWHGVQSFVPGEVTPAEAHEIGMKLAQRMWGDKYQVIVTTHCDKKHIHNHFVFNSVSYIDGKKYNYNNSEIYRFRKESDRLCVEYGLSVIKDNSGRGVSYYEWLNSGNKKTVRSLIKDDIDLAIENSVSLREVFSYLENNLGYIVNTRGKYVTLRPPGSTVAFRLQNIDRNKRYPQMPNRYTEEAIIQRLRNKASTVNYTSHTIPTYKKYHNQMLKSNYDAFDYVDTLFSGTTVRGMYWKYYYLLTNVEKQKTKYPQSHFNIRKEALKNISNYSKRIAFMSRNKINTIEDLRVCKELLDKRISNLIKQRDELRYELRFCDDIKQTIITVQITKLNEELQSLRKEQVVCKDIIDSNDCIKEQLQEIESEEKNQAKERKEQTQWQQKTQ